MSSQKVLSKGRRYTEQQKEQAVRLVQFAREEGRGFAAVQRIADQLGYGSSRFGSGSSGLTSTPARRPG